MPQKHARGKRMKKTFFFFCFMAAALISCGGGSGITPSFDREAFDHERQLWLEQDIQNYSFYQRADWQITKAVGPKVQILFVQKGIVEYFYYNFIWPDGRTPQPVGPLHKLDDFPPADKFFNRELRISISDIYAEIERCANLNRYEIEVQYDNELHYPAEMLFHLSADNYHKLRIYNFVIDPEIPELQAAAGGAPVHFLPE